MAGRTIAVAPSLRPDEGLHIAAVREGEQVISGGWGVSVKLQYVCQIERFHISAVSNGVLDSNHQSKS